METWKSIKGYEGLYQVSNYGNVRSVDRINNIGKHNKSVLLKLQVNKRTGYVQVALCKEGVRHRKTVHRLVAIAFIDNPKGYETVNHKNEIKTDNRVENLEWMSLKDNLAYGTHTKRANEHKPDQSGKNHFNYGLRGAESHTHKGKVTAISITDPNNVLIFDTAATASRELGISSGGICEAIQGKKKSCHGYYWRRDDG